MEILVVATGILILGGEDVFDHSRGFLIPCKCQQWSETSMRCQASEHLHPTACGMPLRVTISAEPLPNRFSPISREIVEIDIAWFHPADLDLDGRVGRTDLGTWFAAGPWDWNQDQSVTIQDTVDLFASVHVPCVP